jgi:hypothetical protein
MTLKVYNLVCSQGHVFEGWFASAEACDDQQARGLLTCPVCGTHEVKRGLSAPRLNLAAGRGSHHGPATEVAPDPKALAQALRALRQWVSQADNVGTAFAAEALRMHRGEIPERAIRGQTTAEQRHELLEEGVPILPIPDFLDEQKLN